MRDQRGSFDERAFNVLLSSTSLKNLASSQILFHQEESITAVRDSGARA